MTQKPILALQHKVSLSVGGIVRYRIKVQPSQAHLLDTLQFRIRNGSPFYRNLTPSSGPWKISLALIRNPAKLPAVPQLVPSIGCAQSSRLDTKVLHEEDNCDNDNGGENDGTYEPGCNEWELEVLSEMVLQTNCIDIKVEVYVVPREDVPASDLGENLVTEDSVSAIAAGGGLGGSDGADVEVQPQVMLPNVLSCEYKDTTAICGPVFPQRVQGGDAGEDLHLVVLTHGIHGTWLDMLYLKEQIDAHAKHNGKTVTFLTDTNHAGTEEGIQMAGQRVALDILELTGYDETEDGKELCKSISTVARKKSLSKVDSSSRASNGNGDPTSVFPRGFSKVSIIGHSLGGLINIYALGYIEDLTKGVFFKTIRPTQFVTLATPFLGIGFEHPWVLGYALSLGVIGQTGKDLALEHRSSKLERSTSTLSWFSKSTSSSASTSSSKRKNKKDKELLDAALATSSDGGSMGLPECALDCDPEPLLLAMARPGGVSSRVLRQFNIRTLYANIENDMAVRYLTSSMMGIPTFDMDQFFSPEGAATQPKKSLYLSALTSISALLFPSVPTKARFLGLAEAPSPIVVVSHARSGAVVEVQEEEEEEQKDVIATKDISKGIIEETSHSPDPKASPSGSQSSSTLSQGSSTARVSTSKASSSSLATGPLASKSRLEIARLVAEGYGEMDWTKIGVFIEHEAHVQIIVRRQWYNVDGWKCVQDLIDRFDFS